MTTLFVKKLEWERGEEFGDVFYPSDDFTWKEKIVKLHAWAKTQDYPFLVFMEFEDSSIELALTVGHFYSYMQFTCDIHSEKRSGKDVYWLVNPVGDVNEIVPFYFQTHYTEPDTTRMLPFERILEAVEYFVNHRKFPSFICFIDDEVNQMFVEPVNQ